ncbi:MAG: hypothetical protein IH991_00795 [Planctomycetes bacterium]|nr:hypothetical protein [Planctomycetota bacterium]
MRILYLGNNWVGWQVLKWLKQQGEEIVGLVVHPESRRKFGKELLGEINLNPDQLFDGSHINEDDQLTRIRDLAPDIALSVFFGYILRSDFLDTLDGNVFNLHPSLLPYNRGAFPNVWSIIDETPAGVTLHQVDTGVDTGPVLAQKAVNVEAIDTGDALYRKLELASVDLICDVWQRFSEGSLKRRRQMPNSGTTYRRRDIEKVDRIHLDRTYLARDLINILRARTFADYSGAFFETDDGERVNIRVSLEYQKKVA